MIKLLIAFFVLSSAQAFALPVEVTRSIQVMGEKSFDLNAFEFEGIVKLSNCSGALIRFEGAPETNKGLIMTNGHCADLPGGAFLKPGQVLVNKKVKRTVGIFDDKKALHKVNTTQFLYATMTNTDVSIYELELTYKAIKDQFNIDAFTLAPSHPAVNVEMQIISGYWEKGWDCTVEAFIPKLREDAYTFVDSLRYNDACNTTHGTSGSPIIERNTRNIIGINNTGNDNGERCTMDNPCEVSVDGTITVRKGISYGQETYIIYSCLNEQFGFNLKKAGCVLPKP